MNPDDVRDLEIQALRDRLSQASLHINETLDLDAVLRRALDSGQVLTEARQGAITLLDDAGRVQDSFASGLTADSDTEAHPHGALPQATAKVLPALYRASWTSCPPRRNSAATR